MEEPEQSERFAVGCFQLSVHRVSPTVRDAQKSSGRPCKVYAHVPGCSNRDCITHSPCTHTEGGLHSSDSPCISWLP